MFAVNTSDVLVTQENFSVVERTEKASLNLYFSKLTSLTFGRLNNMKVVEPGIL
jgi:hypothetical protein